MLDTLNYRVGPTQGALLVPNVPELQSRTPARAAVYVPDIWNNREGPQAREPSQGLEFQSRATEKYWPKRPSDCQL